MFSTFCHVCPRKHFLIALQSARQFSLSSQCRNSGRFRKMKQASSDFLSRTPTKVATEKTATVFDPDYLDSQVDKMLAGPGRHRLSFLVRDPDSGITEDAENSRDSLISNLNHIHETVMVLGVPEVADIIGGQMFAGGHLRSTTTSCLTLRLADNVILMTDSELHQLITAAYCWPADAGGSETLVKLIAKLDAECARRCDKWELDQSLRLALVWVSCRFRPTSTVFPTTVVNTAGAVATSLPASSLLPFLLLVSYLSHAPPDLSSPALAALQHNVLQEFHRYDQTEIAVIYSALQLLTGPGQPVELKERIQQTHGFRL